MELFRLPLIDADGPYDEIDDGREGDEVDAFVEALQGLGMDECDDGFVDDDETGHEHERAFYGRGQKFSFPMSIGVIFVARFGRDMQAK